MSQSKQGPTGPRIREDAEKAVRKYYKEKGRVVSEVVKVNGPIVIGANGIRREVSVRVRFESGDEETRNYRCQADDSAGEVWEPKEDD